MVTSDEWSPPIKGHCYPPEVFYIPWIYLEILPYTDDIVGLVCYVSLTTLLSFKSLCLSANSKGSENTAS